DAQASSSPDTIAALCDTRPSPSALTHLSFAALQRRATQLAHLLQARGIAPDSLVGLCLERSLELLIAIRPLHIPSAPYPPLSPLSPPPPLPPVPAPPPPTPPTPPPPCPPPPRPPASPPPPRAPRPPAASAPPPPSPPPPRCPPARCPTPWPT